MKPSNILLVAISLAASLTLAGCGIGQGAGASPGTVPGSYALGEINGIAHGGLQPDVGATVKIYATQNNGYGGNGLFLAEANDQDGGTQGDGHDTNSQGAFQFSASNYVTGCPAGQYAYIVISGGNAGGGVNPNMLLMSMLGSCSSLFNVSGNGETYGPTTPIFVNEVTTVAAAYALSNFISISGSTSPFTVNISAPVSNNFSDGTVAWNGSAYATCSGTACNGNATFSSGAETTQANGLQHAVLNSLNLASLSTGSANSTVTTGAAGATGTIPAAEINTVANALQQCVNSAGSGTVGSSAVSFTAPSTPTSGAGASATLTVTNASDYVYGNVTVAIAGGTATVFTEGLQSLINLQTLLSSTSSITGVFSTPTTPTSGTGATASLTFPVSSSISLGSVANISGTLDITVGSTLTPITVVSGTSLSALATQINNAATGVTASATGNTLNMTGPTGTSNTLSFSGSSLADAFVSAQIASNVLTLTGPVGASNTMVLTGTSLTDDQDSTNCGAVFALTPSLTNTIATNPLQAAMNLAKNPYSSASNVSNLLNFQAPQVQVYSPHLTSPPADWTLSIVYSGGGLNVPYNIALDANDTVYAVNRTATSSVTAITSSGNFSSGASGFSLSNNAAGTLANAQSIALDSLGNFFVANNVTGNAAGTFAGTWEYSASTGSYENVLTHANGSPSPTLDPISDSDYIGITRRNDVFVSQAVVSTANLDYWVCGGTNCSTYLPDLAVAQLSGGTAPTTAGELEPVINSSGVFTGCTLVTGAAGAGYSSVSPPTVTVVGAGGSGASATATVSSGALTGACTANLVGGSGYTPSNKNTYSDGGFTESSTATAGTQNFGIAVDPYQNVWFATQGSTGTAGTFISVLTNNTPGAQGTYPVYDNSVTAGTAPYANSKLTSTTSTNCGSAPYAIAIDSSNNGWVTVTGSVPSTSALTPTGALCKIAPTYTTTNTPSTVMKTTPAPTSAISVSSAGMPEALAIDGNNVLWIPIFSYNNSSTGFANYGVAAYSIANSALISEPTNGFIGCGVTGTATTCTAGSTSTPGVTTGTAINDPRQAAIDSAGTIWLNNPNGNYLTETIGTAAPTVPLLSAAKFGVEP